MGWLLISAGLFSAGLSIVDGPVSGTDAASGLGLVAVGTTAFVPAEARGLRRALYALGFILVGGGLLATVL